MLSGINASWSFFGGSILAWGISTLLCGPLRANLAYSHSIVVAPSLVKNGLAFGVEASDEFPLVSYNALSFDDPSLYATHPSPRYWLLCKSIVILPD